MFKISNNDFKILIKYKDLIKNIDDLLENVPRKDMYYKDKMRKVLDDTLEYIFRSSYENDKNKIEEYRVIIKSNIALIDFMIDRLNTKKFINDKNVYKIGNYLIEINKMVTGWLNGLLK